MARDGNRPVEIQHESHAAVQAHRRARPHLSGIDEQREDQGAHACRYSSRVLSDVARQQGSYSHWYTLSLSLFSFDHFFVLLTGLSNSINHYLTQMRKIFIISPSFTKITYDQIKLEFFKVLFYSF